MARTTTAEIVLNGSHGEGGGALLRTALAVSCLTQQPVRIHHIRGATRKPGLTSEDLTYIQALASSCAAVMVGDDLDSHMLSFTQNRAPRPLRTPLDVRSHEKGSVPGNALMIIQSLLPVLARAGAYSVFSVTGETYNPNTLTYDVFERATLPMHTAQGIVGFSSLISAGFGYAGHGEVHVEVEPSCFQGFDWSTRGELKEVTGVISFREIHAEIIERGIAEAEKLAKAAQIELTMEAQEVPGRQPGVHVSFCSAYERGRGCGTAMGTRGGRIETMVRYAFEQLTRFMKSKATLDPYLADQALVAAAFAPEPTVFLTEQITVRLQTMAWVIRQFMPISITILGRPGEQGKVTVTRA